MILTRRGLESPKDSDISKTVKKELTVSPLTFDQAFPTRFKVYDETATTYVAPQHWRMPPGVVDARKPGRAVALPFVGALKPELRQPEAARAVMDSLRATGGAVLALATGLGKTSVALWIASQLGAKTVVVVGKEFLAAQWEERIAMHLPTAKVSRVQGKTLDTSGDIVIAMLQTLAKRKHDGMFEDCQFLIVDEVQHVGAEHFTMGLVGLALPMTLGLSATPTRRDGLTRVIHWYLGPLAFGVKRTGQDNVTVRVMTYNHPKYNEPPPLNRRGDLCYTSIVTMLVELDDRTRAIAHEAERLALAGRRVLVLSHRRGHATAIAETLKSSGIDAATYLGGDKTAPDSSVTCATYALVSEGYDDARLSALVLATPTSDVVQAAGRVMRGGGGSDPVIIDFVDGIGICYAQLAKRKRFYKDTGFVVVGDYPDDTKDTPGECMFADD